MMTALNPTLAAGFADVMIPVIVAVIWALSWVSAEVQKSRKKKARQQAKDMSRDSLSLDDLEELDELEELPGKHPQPGPAKHTQARIQGKPPTAGSWDQLLKDPEAWIKQMQGGNESVPTKPSNATPGGRGIAASSHGSGQSVRSVQPAASPRAGIPPQQRTGVGGARRGGQPVPTRGAAPGRPVAPPPKPVPASRRRVATTGSQPHRPATRTVQTPTHDVSEHEIGTVDAFAAGEVGSKTEGASSSEHQAGLGLLNRDALRRAVLLAEVLAPPIAMRSPDQQPGARA